MAKKRAPKTPSQRQAAYIAKGRAIYIVLTDPLAIAALERLERELDGTKAAITVALQTCGRASK